VRVWELDSSEAIKRAAREGLGVAFLSRYAVAEEIERGELASFRLSGQSKIERRLYVARLARAFESERARLHHDPHALLRKERRVRGRLRLLATF
jgi:DNA-binding transcriptional LysR family regulator